MRQRAEQELQIKGMEALKWRRGERVKNNRKDCKIENNVGEE